jgi:hypothetical protein
MFDDYDHAFNDGLSAAATLMRAGCSPDDLAALLPVDPGHKDPPAYQAHLAELRRIMHTDLLTEVTP